MRPVEIRDAAPGDAIALAALLGELGYPATPGEVARRLAALAGSGADRVLVAVLDGRVAGLASLNVAPLFAGGGALARVTALVVGEGHRGAGVGAALLGAAERSAVNSGCSMVQVSSGRRPERDAAHRFYRARGYADAGSHHVLYEKSLH